MLGESLRKHKVFVDSFRSITLEAQHLASDFISLQRFVQQLGVQLSCWQATTFLIGEYLSEGDPHPIFTMADGLLALSQNVQRNSMVRKIQVLKMRSTRYPGSNWLWHQLFARIFESRCFAWSLCWPASA